MYDHVYADLLGASCGNSPDCCVRQFVTGTAAEAESVGTPGSADLLGVNGGKEHYLGED